MKDIQAKYFSIGKKIEEIQVDSSQCPIRRHAGSECACIMRNTRDVAMEACPYYHGYTEQTKNKELIVLLKCDGQGKPLVFHEIAVKPIAKAEPKESTLLATETESETHPTAMNVEPPSPKEESTETSRSDEWSLFDFAE